MVAIYVIGHDESGPVKIGFGKNPRQRLVDIQIGSHLKLELLHEMAADPVTSERIERHVHKALEPHAIRGEWFNVTASVARAAIEAAPKQISEQEREWERVAAERAAAKKEREQQAARQALNIEPIVARLHAVAELLNGLSALSNVGEDLALSAETAAGILEMKEQAELDAYKAMDDLTRELEVSYGAELLDSDSGS